MQYILHCKDNGDFFLFTHVETPDNFLSYFEKSSSESKFVLTQANMKKYLKKQDKRDWKTLDELFEFQSSVWKILVANDSNVTNWQEHKLVCNCPFYLKNNLCKHNMALAAALKFVNIPLEARSLPMESKPKRGRRSQATKALLVQ